MKWTTGFFAWLLLVLLDAFAPVSGAAADSPPLDYNRDVWPIFRAHCVGCHTSDDPEGGLNMQDFQAFAVGGEHGPAFTPGVPASSRLLRMAAGKQQPVMPPEGDEPLTVQQLDILTAWIEQGAGGPSGNTAPTMLRTPEIPANSTLRPVTALAISPAGTQVAMARFGEVEIRDRQLKNVLQTITIPAGKINALQFDASGERLLIAGGISGLEGHAEIRQLSTGQRVAVFNGHRDALFDARFSPAGDTLATAGYDRKIMLWDIASESVLHTIEGHNGAIYQLAYSADGSLLATASADETVKIWNAQTGQRLDTLPQPQGEVFAVTFTPDDERLIAASADNRFRAWQVLSRRAPQINPLLVTRFADEAPLTHAAISLDGKRLVVVSEGGNLKTFRTDDWTNLSETVSLGDTASDLQLTADGSEAIVSLMNGEVRRVDLPAFVESAAAASQASTVTPVYVQLAAATEVTETRFAADWAEQKARAATYHGPRGFRVAGVIQPDEAGIGETDRYRFHARQGEVWVVETEAAAIQSPLDTIVEVFDGRSEAPLIAARLQAVRDSYFTFRGKDSTQSGDFRLFAWEEMELNDYLYAAGEVTKLWMYPRGPDSGFNVYPGAGQRWTYFGTSGVSHALGEPAYIVRPLPNGVPPSANGLPVFEVPVANDDDPRRRRGTDSQVIFTAPRDGSFVVAVRDARGEGGQAYRYKLTARPAAPHFVPRIQVGDKPIPPGAGRELSLKIDRIDGFAGSVQFELGGLPEGLHVTSPVTIEAGQNEAFATIWAEARLTAADVPEPAPLIVIASADIVGRRVELEVPVKTRFTVGEAPPLTLQILPIDRDVELAENWTLTLRPGETVRARVKATRKGHQGEIALGKETAGRNTAHGVFVDNIGLSGLLITADADQREFFLTAAPITAPGERSFFLKSNVQGGITTPPITLKVLDIKR